MRHLLLIALFLGIFSGVAASQSSDDLARADSLFKNYQEKEALAAYNNILNNNPKNVSALWHASLLYSRLGNQLESDDREKEYYRDAKKLAEQALDEDSTNTQANFVMAVAMGRMALIVGAKERVAASRDIKKYAERSLEADSSNAGAWHVLGRWNYEISNLNFAERLAANVLFGGVPEGASTENAVEYINKAIDLNPDFILYYSDLANVYKERGDEDKAVQSCETAMEKEVHTYADEQAKKECGDLLDDLK